MSRYKDMKDNKDKIVFSMNIREQRQKEACGCGGNCACNNSVVKKRELKEKRERRENFWNVFKIKE